MMKYLSIIICSMFLYLSSTAQQRFDNNSNRVVSLKIAYITEKLNLTEKEAEKFWPIYKKYDNELKDIRAARAEDKIDILAYEEKVLQVRKKYQNEFKKAISDAKVQEFYRAEQQFNNKVQNEFKRRVENQRDRPRSNEERKIKL